jgi:hypothetical protein
MFGKFFRKKSGEAKLRPNDFAKQWLAALETRLGEVSFIKEIQCEGKPKIHVFYFDALPEAGYLTAITCGLSDANHPDWKFGTPELIVTMASENQSWGMAAGYFASSFFGEKRFSYGDMFKLDDPISEESEMNAYLLFAPSFLNREQSKFTLPDRIVNLIGVYPVYDDEIAIYDRIGLKAFWNADGFEMYNPKRDRISVS